MKTCIIFFGKSQDFIFYAFDESNLIENFDNVIRNFDLLESKNFTVDDINNKEILAKYNFKVLNKSFSLIKLFSFAQAFNGDRIAGSIYGVALLSEMDLEFSKNNLDLLKAAKENFAKLSLNSLKFNKSDFLNDVIKIWKAIINSNEGNYFNMITTNGSPTVSNTTKIKGFYVNSLVKNSFELSTESDNASRIYVSEDLEHLKRTNKRWGDTIFPIYLKENGTYIFYKESKALVNNLDKDTKSQSGNSHSNSDHEDLYSILNKKIYKLKRQLVLISVSFVLFFLLTTALIFNIFSRFSELNVKIANVNTIPNNKTTINQKNTSVTSVQKEIESDQHNEQPPPFPIWENEESNEFRKWVNLHHPDYAKENNLDKRGPSNNQIMKKTWKKFGAEFNGTK